jgi:hypothetical protein
VTLPSLLAVAVIVFAVPLNWYVALRLWWLSRHADNWALRAHVVVAVMLALIVTVFAVIFVNNDMAVPPLDPETTRIITRAAMLGLSVPGLYWLWLVRRS